MNDNISRGYDVTPHNSETNQDHFPFRLTIWFYPIFPYDTIEPYVSYIVFIEAQLGDEHDGKRDETTLVLDEKVVDEEYTTAKSKSEENEDERTPSEYETIASLESQESLEPVGVWLAIRSVSFNCAWAQPSRSSTSTSSPSSSSSTSTLSSSLSLAACTQSTTGLRWSVSPALTSIRRCAVCPHMPCALGRLLLYLSLFSTLSLSSSPVLPPLPSLSLVPFSDVSLVAALQRMSTTPLALLNVHEPFTPSYPPLPSRFEHPLFVLVSWCLSARRDDPEKPGLYLFTRQPPPYLQPLIYTRALYPITRCKNRIMYVSHKEI